MYGFGSALKRNYTSAPIEMVDHYNLFCHLLNITPLPNNGTQSKALDFLKAKSLAIDWQTKEYGQVSYGHCPRKSLQTHPFSSLLIIVLLSTLFQQIFNLD